MKSIDVSGVVHSIVQDVRNFFPFSPAKKGPFSGDGYTLYSGQKLMRDFAKGMAMEAPTLASTANSTMQAISFGPGAVQVGFYGQVPTAQQAQQTGEAAGAGISDQLAARNARLAVRTM